MSRLNLLKLRKAAGITQIELAKMLSVQPSFLSAIENGKSRFPDDKLGRLKEIVMLDSLEDYFEDDSLETNTVVPPHSHSHLEADPITELLKHIHAQAHKSDGDSMNKITELNEKIDFLSKRNDRLTQKNDELRDRLDNLLEENFRLKELLLRHNIDYSQGSRES